MFSGKHDLSSSQEGITGGWPVALALHAKAEPQPPCLVYQCDQCLDQLWPTGEKAGILPTPSSTTTGFAPPWRDLLPSTLRCFEPFRVSGTSQYGGQTVLPAGWPRSILQVHTCSWFLCCATEELWGWVSPKVLMSMSFWSCSDICLIAAEPLFPPWDHGTMMKILLEGKPTVYIICKSPPLYGFYSVGQQDFPSLWDYNFNTRPLLPFISLLHSSLHFPTALQCLSKRELTGYLKNRPQAWNLPSVFIKKKSFSGG